MATAALAPSEVKKAFASSSVVAPDVPAITGTPHFFARIDGQLAMLGEDAWGPAPDAVAGDPSALRDGLWRSANYLARRSAGRVEVAVMANEQMKQEAKDGKLN